MRPALEAKGIKVDGDKVYAKEVKNALPLRRAGSRLLSGYRPL